MTVSVVHAPHTDGGDFGKLPKADGVIARLAYARAVEAGVDAPALLAKAGLTAHQIEDRTTRIRANYQIAFLDLTARALKDDCLGFEIARNFEVRELGWLHYVMASSSRLGDALQRAERYCAIANEGISLSYREGTDIALTIAYVGVARHSDQHQMEALATLIVRECQKLTGREMRPSHVRFTHHRDKVPAKFRTILGDDISFGARRDVLVFPGTVKDLAVVSADPYLNRLLVAYCEDALSHRMTKRGAVRLDVENAIIPLLPHGNAHAAQICDRIGMSQRTLTRRLGSEGLTFAKVLDDLRHDLALRYLRDKNLAISTVAWLLGYKEVSSFTHACKRWTGKTPKQLRSEVAIQ